MADLYASNSGWVYRAAIETWSTIRNNATGDHHDGSVDKYTDGMLVQQAAARGADYFKIVRSYFYFDTSGITGTLSEATLKIYGFGGTATADVIAVKSDAFGGDNSVQLALTDYNNLDFSTAYSAQFDATWSISAYNDMPLNAAALADMKNNDHFIVCVIEHDHDYADSAASGGAIYQNGAYYDQYGTSRGPYIDYTVSTGYGHTVSGVAAANIGKVAGVATASIEKVIGFK